MSNSEVEFKPGDKLYRVYADVFGAELQHVTIARVTAQGVWFEKTGGLAFSCRTRMDTKAARHCGLTPEEAIESYVKDAQQMLQHALKAFETAERWAKKLRGQNG